MKIFISYNSKNRHFAEVLARNLTKNGFEVFYDVDSIQAGDVWTKKIQDGMRQSDASLICIGEEGIGEWQNKEVLDRVKERTQNNAYRLIPLVLPANNGFVNYPLPWFLADYQWVEFKDASDNYAFSKLLEGLRVQQEGGAIQIGQNPYKGLKSFEVDDAACFFGRTYSLNLVFHNKLRFQVSILDHNFLAIVADSGVGKSSFVKAGILAALRNGKFAGSNNWKQIIFKPGHSPKTALSSNLKIKKLIVDTRTFEENFINHTDELLRTIRDQEQTWVIYIDQFEEIITQCKDETERTAFLNNIARAVETEKAIVLLSVRSDFYTAFAPYPLFKSILEKNNYTLSGIDLGNKEGYILKEIIVQPAKNAGVKIDDSLVDSLINDLKQVKGKLPILQLALDLLWQNKKQANKITLEDYAAIAKNKNIAGIIEAHADTVFNNITGNDTQKAELFKKIFVPHLVEISNNGEDVRKTAFKSDLLAIIGFTKEEIEKMLQDLSSEDARLLTMQETDKQTKVEVVHEVIIREWPMLKGWIDERREALVYRDRIMDEAKDYKNGQGYLYKGKMLQRAVEWQKGNPDLTNREVDGFIRKSKKNTNRRLVIAIGSFAFLIIAAIFFSEQYKRAQFIREMRNIPSFEEQYEAQGGNIDSIKALKVDASNYLAVKNRLFYFKNLDSLIIDRLPVVDLSLLSGVTSIKSLTISNDSITSLFGIENLNSLISLYIDGNDNLISLHGIEKLNLLQSLKISSNKELVSLKGIKKLSSLIKLELYENKKLINFQGIEQLKSLRFLWIFYNNNLINLQGIGQLDSLTELLISNDNSLVSLQGINQFNSLTTLIVEHNDNLTDMQGIEQLGSLTSLEVSENRKLRSLKMDKLSSLTSLKVSNNDSLTSLNGIEKLNLLKSLTIYGKIQNYLKEFKKFGFLTSLVTDVDDSLISLHKIEKLNSLKSLVLYINTSLNNLKGIEQLSLLTSLEVSSDSNCIDLQGLEQLTYLKSLELHCSNKLASLHEIGKLRSLTSLMLEHNNVMTSLQVIGQSSSLNTLVLALDSDLISLQGIEQFSLLKSLTLYFNNKLSNLYGIEQLSSLTSLEISNNYSLTSIQGIENLSSLKSLEISYTRKLGSLQGIEKLDSLKSLVILENFSLRNFPAIEKLQNLDTLEIGRHEATLLDVQKLYNFRNIKVLTIPRNFNVDYDRLSENNPGIKLIRESDFL